MMRTKTGKIKPQYEDILGLITPPIQEIVRTLIERGLTAEEVIGIIAGQTTLSVSSELIRKKIDGA